MHKDLTKGAGRGAQENSGFFAGKLVLVAGGTGLIGAHLTLELLRRGARVRIVRHTRPLPFEDPRLEVVAGDLRRGEDCKAASKGVDIVCNSAAVVGGVLRNEREPSEIFTQNLLLSTQLLEAARLADVERYLFVSNNGVYPTTAKPSVEDEGWRGQPDKSVFAYGWAKRIGELQARLYSEQYGMKVAIGRGTNSYGEWDNFNLDTSHVIPALIRKALSSSGRLTLWGSGNTVRDFIHATDKAKGMLDLLEHHAVCDPVNIATGRPITIRRLAEVVLRLAGRKAEVAFDASRPSGQRVKLISTTKARRVIGFRPGISLEVGLKKTIDWYRKTSPGGR